MTPPKPGAYRAIFQKSVECYMRTEGPRMNDQELSDCGHYLRLLSNPEFKFGRFEATGPQNYSSGELFFRS